MPTRYVMTGAVALGLGLVCARAGADFAPSPQEVEARAARAEAKTDVWSMESASRRARAVLQQARKRGFTREVRCADEHLSRADSALRSGRESAALLGEAWSRGDARWARIELARVEIAAEAAVHAGSEAEQCIDEPRPAEGTTVRLTIDTR